MAAGGRGSVPGSADETGAAGTGRCCPPSLRMTGSVGDAEDVVQDAFSPEQAGYAMSARNCIDTPDI